MFNTNVSVDTREDLQKAIKRQLQRAIGNSILYQSNHSNSSDISEIQKMIENREKNAGICKKKISIL